MSVSDATTVLDVGGTPETWTGLGVRPRVTLLNMPRAGVGPDAGFVCVGADGCRLPFADGAFDVVFSNSVIEHVGSEERQRDFAEEVRRVGRSYWVQTPNYWFPIEAHLLTPGVHFLPKTWQRAVLERGSVWEWLEKPSADRREFYIEHFLNDIRLLGAGELRALFPGARIVRERSIGLTKSLVAVKTV
ncbi:MAG: methyltransferase domain-containing protein [Bryobacteraceae bacterium]|nr:methyltransferase domain-containing protein [Bryobacteraceae bacterium]